MTTAWVDDVKSPESVDIGDTFYVSIRIKYRTLPWWLGGRLTGLFSNINRGEVMLDEKHTYFKPWWFWGSKLHSYQVHGINRTTLYFGDIGWSD